MTIVFVTYETPFAPCGGIAAVMSRLPAQVARLSGEATVVLSPLHHKLPKAAALLASVAGEVRVPLDGGQPAVSVVRYDDPRERGLSWQFLRCEDARLFAGAPHPYAVPHGDLLRDALFFGAAAGQALEVVAAGQPCTLLLQDWEGATAALALAAPAGVRSRHRLFLTLHNSYDTPCHAHDLKRVGIAPELCPALRPLGTFPLGVGRPAEGVSSLLQRALGRVEETVFTVSEQFALDLTTDLLQTQTAAPHLAGILRSRLRGIDNGPFVDLSAPQDVLAQAAVGQMRALWEWKASQRTAFLEALQELTPAEDRPVWGDVQNFCSGDCPWFVMAGRDDGRQKGYDVAAAAAEAYLDAGGTGQFLFFPIPGDEGLPGLAFLRRLAEKHAGRVLIVPFIFREGFMPALRGAAFGIMPSLYEPFGMANEFYLNGAAAIGRATGGIVQQVVPLRSAACFSRAVQDRSQRWHPPAAQPTGLLFRERDGLESAAADWAAFNAAGYQGSGRDRVEERRSYALFRAMAHELALALRDAARIWRDWPHLYGAMVAAGAAHIQQNFSWERAAAEYVRSIG
jgi:glycogen synthase